MLFNSGVFIVFFLVFYSLYLASRNKQYRVILILLGSYFFYGWWDWRFLSLILFSTIVDYLLGKKIYGEKSKIKRKTLVTVSIFTNLGLLFFFKYFNFFIESFIEVSKTIGLPTSVNSLKIILPVGISFYTFQTLSYTIDIYRNKLKPENNFLVFASYVAFFPQLVAGPIVRAIDLLPQFKSVNIITKKQIRIGVFLIVLGYFKKLVVADSLAPLVDDAFANPSTYTSFNMIILIVFYSFQIYCDFSGYSDIAIGLGKLLGFNFPVNFNLPYFAKNFSDFWKRWHISLSSWLKDYLYIPLGGNRNGNIFTQRNLMITMVLGGLWHGANWTFIVWGFLHGTYLILQRTLSSLTLSLKTKLPKLFYNIISIVITYTLVNIAWVFFRSQSITEAIEIFDIVFSIDGFQFSALRTKFQLLKAFLVIGILYFSEMYYYNFKQKTDSLFKNNYVYIFIIAFLLWMILLLGTNSSNNFIYFQF